MATAPRNADSQSDAAPDSLATIGAAQAANARILMCQPDYYGVEYEINPWMDRRRPPERRRVMRQWWNLRRFLEDAGAAVDCITPLPGQPDLVFTANAAIVRRDVAVLSRFRHIERRGEEPHFRQWFATHGFRVEQLPEDLYFEGTGDALFCGDILYAGYRIRSHALAHQQVAAMLGCCVIPLELVDPYFYHLDTCFCPLAQGQAIWYPEAFDAYAQKALRATIDDLIAADVEEARRFACNAVVVGRTVITNVGCERLHAELRARGFAPRATPLDEFVKAGGSAKCLTLRLDGEEAAGWKTPS